VFKGVIPPRPWGVLAVANAGRCTTSSGNSHTPERLRLPAENSRVVLGLIFPAPQVVFLKLLCPHSKQLGALVTNILLVTQPPAYAKLPVATILAVVKKGTQRRPQGREGLSKSTARICTFCTAVRI